jgi:hypothetical protein
VNKITVHQNSNSVHLVIHRRFDKILLSIDKEKKKPVNSEVYGPLSCFAIKNAGKTVRTVGGYATGIQYIRTIGGGYSLIHSLAPIDLKELLLEK